MHGTWVLPVVDDTTPHHGANQLARPLLVPTRVPVRRRPLTRSWLQHHGATQCDGEAEHQQHSDRPAGVRHVHRVKAINAAGAGPRANCVRATPQDEITGQQAIAGGNTGPAQGGKGDRPGKLRALPLPPTPRRPPSHALLRLHLRLASEGFSRSAAGPAIRRFPGAPHQKSIEPSTCSP